MNAYRSFLCIWVLFLLVVAFLFSGCKKDKEEEQIPKDNPPVLPETTKIITDEDWDKYLVTLDSTTWTMTFDPQINADYQLDTGDIMISTKGAGLLRKIYQIEEVSGKLIISTVQGTIVEAAPKGRFDFEIDMTEQYKDVSAIWLAEGVKYLGPETTEDGRVELTFSLDIEVHDNVTISGEFSISPTISGTISWSSLLPDTLIIIYEMTETLELETAVDILSLSLEKEVQAGYMRMPPITIPAVIPVVILPVFTLNLGVKLDINSELTCGIRQELSVKAGFSYINGSVTSIQGLGMDLGPIPPELSNTLEAKAYVSPQIDMMIYGMASPYFSMELYGLLEAELMETPWWTLYAGLGCDVGFAIKIFGFAMLDIDLNIFDEKVPLACSDDPPNIPPFASFFVTPGGGAIATVFEFNAMASHDDEDPTDELKVRWDWEDDGDWDTPFSNDKVISHQFLTPNTYDVRMEVVDTKGGTDDTTAQIIVNAEIPCPGAASFIYEGELYHGIQVGDHCWIKENLNVGVMINSNESPGNNGIVEKYCYENDPANCEEYGGLYRWEEAMQYVFTPGAQGICPPGWHIPTDDDWKELEGNVDTQFGVGDTEWDESGLRGYDAGRHLKAAYGWIYPAAYGDDLYGFRGLPGGVLGGVGASFTGILKNAYFWTSNEKDQYHAWARWLRYNYWKSDRLNDPKARGFSVRCVKD